MAASSKYQFSSDLPPCHGPRFPFHGFAFLHQLKQFARRVSRIARGFRIWHSSLVLGCRILATAPFILVRRCARFVFLHQLKQFPKHVSILALTFRI
jgi:hypothetical protein